MVSFHGMISASETLSSGMEMAAERRPREPDNLLIAYPAANRYTTPAHAAN